MQMLWLGWRLGGCEEESGTQDGSALSSSWAAAVAADAADTNKQKHYIEDDKWEYRH